VTGKRVFGVWLRRVSAVLAMVLALVTLPPGGVEPAFAAEETLEEVPDAIWGVTGLSSAFATNMLTQVLAIEQIGNTVYVGGKFLEVVERRDRPAFDQPFLAAFDATTGTWIDWWRPSFNGLVHALEASPDGTRLFVGGEFTSVDGVPDTRGFVSLDPATGEVQSDFVVSVDPPPGSPNPGVVREIAVGANHLYIGGSFNYITGPSRTSRVYVWKVARVSLANGTPDTGWRPVVAGGGVWGIVEDASRGRVHFVGDYNSTNGSTVEKNLSTVNISDGQIVPGLVVPINTTPSQDNYFDIAIAGGRLWLAGTQHEVMMLDINTRQQLRRWFSGYSSNLGYTNIGGDYQSLGVSADGTRLYASCHCWGAFREIGLGTSNLTDAQAFPITLTTPANPTTGIHAFDAVTGDYLDEWKPDIRGSSGGWALHGAPDGCLWAGGDFNRVALGDVYNNGIVRFCDQAGQGPPVAPSLVRPPDGSESNSPTVPTNVTVTITNAGDALVRWNPSTDASGVAFYEVFRNGSLLVSTRLTNGFLDVDYQAGDVYSVRAVDIYGNRSGFGGFAITTVYSTDFESNDGWVTNPNGTDTATAGLWEIAVPQQTSDGGSIRQRGDTTSGSQALVTDGRAGAAVGTWDIDGGVTTVRSPAIALPNADSLSATFDYVFAHSSNSSSADFFRVAVVAGGSTTTVFEQLGASSTRAGAWTRASVDLSAYRGRTVNLLISAADAGGASLVEAMVDTLSVTAIAPAGSPPTVTAPPNQTSTVGQAVSVPVGASDPDNDPLTFSATGLPPGLSINPGTGVISGTPTTEGTYNVVVSVTDGVSPVTAGFTWTVSAFVQGSYAAEVEADGAIAYWRLSDTGGTAVDQFGLANATFQGSPALGAGSLVDGGDTAVTFDGVNDLVAVPDTALINTGGPFERRTVELWFRADQVTNRGVLFEGGSTGRGLSVYVVNGLLYAGAWNTTNNGDGTTPWAAPVFVSTPVAANTTYHVVAVMDQPSGTFTLYVNGAQAAQAGGVGRLFGHGGDVGIGGQNDDGRYHDRGDAAGDKFFFDGVIDDVSIYNLSLTAAQVQSHYLAGSPDGQPYDQLVLAQAPAAYWRLDEAVGATTAVDLTGGNNAVYRGGPVLAWAGLISGTNTAMNLDGVNDFVDVPNAAELNTGGPYETKTIEMWFRPSNVTATQVLYEQGSTSRGINVYVEGGRVYGGLWNRVADDPTTPWASDVWLDAPVSVNTTYHLALVYDYPSNLATLYLNGVPVDSTSGFGRLFAAGGAIGIGAQNDNARFATRGDNAGDRWFFSGTIDEVAHYNTALDAATIQTHYLTGN
jgi:hypothetical protein